MSLREQTLPLPDSLPSYVSLSDTNNTTTPPRSWFKSSYKPFLFVTILVLSILFFVLNYNNSSSLTTSFFNSCEYCVWNDTQRQQFLTNTIEEFSYYNLSVTQTGEVSYSKILEICHAFAPPSLIHFCNNFNNPSLVYAPTSLPPQCYNNQCPPETPNILPNKSILWQLAQNEAIVEFGCLPPQAAYFGIEPMLYEQNSQWCLACTNDSKHIVEEPPTTYGENPETPTTPSRNVIFSPWGDTLNFLTLNSTHVGNNTPWGEIMVLIISANPKIVADISKAFQSNGLPITAINVYGIPNAEPYIHLFEGNSSLADSFELVHRIGKPFINQTLGDLYLQQSRITALRVVSTSTVYTQSYKTPTRRVRASIQTEAPLLNALKQLIASITLQFGTPHKQIQAQPKNFHPLDCIFKQWYCWGNNEDFLYLDFNHTFSLVSNNNFVILVGVIHQATRLAVYDNYGLFNSSGTVIGSIDNSMLSGTAKIFDSNLSAHVANKLFAIKIQNSCQAEVWPCTRPTLLSHTPLNEIQIQARAVLNPSTKTGPFFQDVVYSLLLDYTT